MIFSFYKTIIKSIFKKPATRGYPFVTREPFNATRGKIGIHIDQCIFCGICAKRCPSQAIEVKKENKSWEIDVHRCITCKLCVDVCPKKCLTQANIYSKASVSADKEFYKAQ